MNIYNKRGTIVKGRAAQVACLLIIVSLDKINRFFDQNRTAKRRHVGRPAKEIHRHPKSKEKRLEADEKHPETLQQYEE